MLAAITASAPRIPSIASALPSGSFPLSPAFSSLVRSLPLSSIRVPLVPLVKVPQGPAESSAGPWGLPLAAGASHLWDNKEDQPR